MSGTRCAIRANAAIDRVTLDGVVTAADTGARTITGRVAEYGVIGATSAGRVRFAPGSLAAADPGRIKLLIEHDPERVIGWATSVAEENDGVTATFHVAPGPLGDQALASAAGGLRDGLSVGANITAGAWNETDDCLDVAAAAWRETSMVTVPAYAGAIVTRVAASNSPAVPSQPGGHGGAAGPVTAPGFVPVAYTAPRYAAGRQVETVTAACDRIAAAWNVGGVSAAMQAINSGAANAALVDIVPPTGAIGDIAFRPQWLGELWQARPDTKRPIIDVIGKKPLTAYKMQGFQVTWPDYLVDEYDGNKTAIPSGLGPTLTPIETTAKRLAGGNDVDRVFFDLGGGFGSGSFIEDYFSRQTDNYIVKSESLVAAEIYAAAHDLDVTGTLFDALVAVATYLGARGARVSFFKVAPDLFGQAMAIKAIDAPWLLGGSTINLTDDPLKTSIGGLTFEVEPTLPAGGYIAGDARSATYFEWKNPPLRVEAVNIPNGGIDLAVFGYWALLINDPASIVSGTVTAPIVP
jgi:HK97 family phage prohead protease